MQALPLVKGTVPHSARQALEHLLPEPGLSYRVRHRIAGLGSLGRPRYVALAEWQGGTIAREAKAQAPTAFTWAQDGRGARTIRYQELLIQAVHCREPFVHVHDTWLVRRLSPCCSRIELGLLPKRFDEDRLLYAMGWEIANVHLGTRRAQQILRGDLAKRKAKWLRTATKAMVRATKADWKEWRVRA
jgi:hypothetical protein